MFVVTEAEAAAIRAAFDHGGEFSAAVELRRLFPGVTATKRRLGSAPELSPRGSRCPSHVWTLQTDRPCCAGRSRSSASACQSKQTRAASVTVRRGLIRSRLRARPVRRPGSTGFTFGSRTLATPRIEAASNDEADRIVRDMPLWGALEWKVTPLQSLEGRKAMEQVAGPNR